MSEKVENIIQHHFFQLKSWTTSYFLRAEQSYTQVSKFSLCVVSILSWCDPVLTPLIPLCEPSPYNFFSLISCRNLQCPESVLWRTTYRLYKLLRFCHTFLKEVSFFKTHHSSLSLHFVHSLAHWVHFSLGVFHLFGSPTDSSKPLGCYSVSTPLNALVEVKEGTFDASFHDFSWPSVALVQNFYSWYEW